MPVPLSAAPLRQGCCSVLRSYQATAWLVHKIILHVLHLMHMMDATSLKLYWNLDLLHVHVATFGLLTDKLQPARKVAPGKLGVCVLCMSLNSQTLPSLLLLPELQLGSSKHSSATGFNILQFRQRVQVYVATILGFRILLLSLRQRLRNGMLVLV